MMTWYKKQLYDITKELASNMAWHSFMLKIKDDIEKKQALQGWQLTMKKIGKGTGKQAAVSYTHLTLPTNREVMV